MLRFVVRMTIALIVCLACATAFVPATTSRRGATSLSMALTTLPPPPPAPVTVTLPAASTLAASSSQTTEALSDGVNSWMTTNQDVASSSTLLSLQERKPVTAEEIAAKKRNFNIIFWGGGFVAPFLATFFYFGFKFWEK